MIVGTKGAEIEKLLNELYNTERKMFACQYDCKQFKYLWYRRKCEKLKKKIDKLSMENKNTCDTCENKKTMDCPNSDLCFNIEDKPYYRRKNNGKKKK